MHDSTYDRCKLICFVCNCSRLTAFVLRSLSDIHSFYGKESFVDTDVLSSAFNYIVEQQQEDRSFKRIGYTTNYRLLVRTRSWIGFLLLSQLFLLDFFKNPYTLHVGTIRFYYI